MASNPLAQPALFLDSVPTIELTGDLFTFEFQGLTLKLTPYAAMGFVIRGKKAFADWNANNSAKAAGVLADPAAQIIAFPKACKIVRVKGEAC